MKENGDWEFSYGIQIKINITFLATLSMKINVYFRFLSLVLHVINNGLFDISFKKFCDLKAS